MVYLLMIVVLPASASGYSHTYSTVIQDYVLYVVLYVLYRAFKRSAGMVKPCTRNEPADKTCSRATITLKGLTGQAYRTYRVHAVCSNRIVPTDTKASSLTLPWIRLTSLHTTSLPNPPDSARTNCVTCCIPSDSTQTPCIHHDNLTSRSTNPNPLVSTGKDDRGEVHDDRDHNKHV